MSATMAHNVAGGRLSSRIDLRGTPAPPPIINPPGLAAGLEAYWKLNETGTSARADSKGSNTLTAGATMSHAAGKIGNAASFDAGAASLLSIADNASLSFGDEDMAITGWLKFTTESEAHVLSKEDETNREYLIYYSPSLHKLSFYVSADGTTSHLVQADSFGVMTTGTWYFFYCEHDPAANTLRISINDGTKDSAAHSGGILNGTAPFRVGNNSDSSQGVAGLVDEVAIWRRKLTDAEVTLLYNGGAGATYPF